MSKQCIEQWCNQVNSFMVVSSQKPDPYKISHQQVRFGIGSSLIDHFKNQTLSYTGSLYQNEHVRTITQFRCYPRMKLFLKKLNSALFPFGPDTFINTRHCNLQIQQSLLGGNLTKKHLKSRKVSVHYFCPDKGKHLDILS